jgi:hypothetical protein
MVISLWNFTVLAHSTDAPPPEPRNARSSFSSMRLAIASLFLVPGLMGLAACNRDADNSSNASLNAPIPSSPNDAAPENPSDNAVPSERTQPSGSAGPNGAQPVRGSLPVAFRGKWVGKGQNCADARSDMLLTAGARELRFYESVGTLISVEGAGPGAIIVTAKYEGEGQSWTQRQKLTLSTDGNSLTILNQGVTSVRRRCPGPA